MKTQIIPLRILLELIFSDDYQEIASNADHKLSKSGHDPDTLKNLLEKITNLEEMLKQQGISLEEWPPLCEEWCALISWLCLELASSSSSDSISRELRRLTIEEYEKNDFPAPEEILWLTGWVCGVISQELLPSYSLQYPLRSAKLSEHEAAIAYEGLRFHLRLLFEMESKRLSNNDFEMSLTAVPIRVSGLCEAISDVPDDEKGYAAKSLGILLKNSQATIPKETYSRWLSNVDHLINTRNAVAHIRDQNKKPNFKDAVQELDIDRVTEIAQISSFVMAGWVRDKFENFDEVKIGHWVSQIEREMDQLIDDYGYF
jgi:hypothetical protein